jgi:hypothetical protein
VTSHACTSSFIYWSLVKLHPLWMGQTGDSQKKPDQDCMENASAPQSSVGIGGGMGSSV